MKGENQNKSAVSCTVVSSFCNRMFRIVEYANGQALERSLRQGLSTGKRGLTECTVEEGAHRIPEFGPEDFTLCQCVCEYERFLDMFVKRRAHGLQRALHATGRPKQGRPSMEKELLPHVLLIVVIASGFLLKVHAYNPLATIAVLEQGRSSLYPTVCAIEIGAFQTLSCWDSPEELIFQPQAGRWIGVVAGGIFMCGLQFPNRNAVCWTFTSNVQFSVPHELKSIAYRDIAAGEDHVCGLRENISKIDCWNTYGIQEFVPESLAYVKLITAGKRWTCTVSYDTADLHTEKIACWLGEIQVYYIVKKNVTFHSISVGESHLCAAYSGTSKFAESLVNREIICWSLSVYGDHYVSTNRLYSYYSLVSGPNYSCGIVADTGKLECWGFNDEPELKGLEGIRFAPGGIAATGSTVCGVGTNAMYSLRSMCVRFDNKKIPQPFRFFLPSICSQTCGEVHLHRFRDRYLSLPGSHDEILHVGENICSEPAETSCIPNYIFHCPSCCPGLITPFGSSACAGKSRFRGLTGAAAALVAVGLFAFLTIILFLWALRASFQVFETDGGRRGLFTKFTSVEHFCQHEAMFNLNLIEFSYKDLEFATNGFDASNLLGQGSSGCVFEGTLPDKRQVAVKKLINSGVYSQNEIYSHFDGELKLLARLRHKNLVNLVGYCHQRTAHGFCCWSLPRLKPSARIEYRLLVFEYMPNGTLYSHLHHKKDQADLPFLEWEMRLRIVLQAAKGINYLHFGTEPPVIHRDIKSSNILLDENWNARLSDLGISRLGPLGNRTHISTLPAGTLGYLDPEYYRSQHLTLKSDVYSFGVVLLEVLTGCRAIEAQLEPANIVERCVPIIRSRQAQSILDPKIPLPSYLETLLLVADIAESCVRMVQLERPSIAEVFYKLRAAAAVANLTLDPEETTEVSTSAD